MGVGHHGGRVSTGRVLQRSSRVCGAPYRPKCMTLPRSVRILLECFLVLVETFI